MELSKSLNRNKYIIQDTHFILNLHHALLEMKLWLSIRNHAAQMIKHAEQVV